MFLFVGSAWSKRRAPRDRLGNFDIAASDRTEDLSDRHVHRCVHCLDIGRRLFCETVCHWRCPEEVQDLRLGSIPETGGYHRNVSTGAEAFPLEIRAAIRAARAAWPQIGLDETRFARRLLEIVGEQPMAALADLCVDDLYLVWACIEGHLEALAVFEARMASVFEATLARLRIERGRRDDLIQELRVHLIVGSGSGPGKLAQYRGQGKLERWLCATALRAAYRLASRTRRHLALEDVVMTSTSVLDDDLVLAHWKDHCRGELKHAFTTALSALPRRDRLLLKQHYLDRLTIEDVAALHKIHRSSAARWLAQVRDALADAALRDFRERLRISESEVESIVQLVRSQLDITFDRFLTGG